MWKLSIDDDQGGRTVVNLARDDYSIGRAEENTIRLTERNISRQHARLVRQGNGWFLEDLRSDNGAFVNGVRIAGRQELAHGDLVQLGDYRIEVNDEALDTREQGHRLLSAPPGVQKRETLTGQPDRFVMLIGPTQGAEFPLEGDRLMIGRGEECDLCINHASVSRVHAEVRSVGDGRYELVDKGSANGVRVNGADLERALLDARDVIELGDVVLKFIPRGQIFRAELEESRLPALRSIPSPALETPEPSSSNKALVAVGAAALLGIALLFVVRARSTEPEAPPRQAVVNSAVDQDRLILDEAVRMAAEGNVFAAHDHLKQISETSAVRQSPELRSLESSWADTMLQAAVGETDPAKKREILDEVARDTDLDAERRSKASAALASLASAAVDVAELPSSAEAGDDEEPPAKAKAAQAKTAQAKTAQAKTLARPAAAKPAAPKPATQVTLDNAPSTEP